MLVGLASSFFGQLFPPEIKNRGYFQSKAKDRIFTVEFRSPADANALLAYAEKAPYTTGQMTALYFYPKGSNMPGEIITKRKSIFEATNTIKSERMSQYAYVYMHYRNGNKEFIKCAENPKHTLCDKKS